MYHIGCLLTCLSEGFLFPQCQNMNIYDSRPAIPFSTLFLFKLTALYTMQKILQLKLLAWTKYRLKKQWVNAWGFNLLINSIEFKILRINCIWNMYCLFEKTFIKDRISPSWKVCEHDSWHNLHPFCHQEGNQPRDEVSTQEKT